VTWRVLLTPAPHPDGVPLAARLTACLEEAAAKGLHVVALEVTLEPVPGVPATEEVRVRQWLKRVGRDHKLRNEGQVLVKE
jgi:hypothetical protein